MLKAFLLKFNFTGTRLRTVWSRHQCLWHFWFLFRFTFNLFIRLRLIIVIGNYNIRVVISFDILCAVCIFRGGRRYDWRLGNGGRYLGAGGRGLPKRRIIVRLDMTHYSGGKVQEPLLVAIGTEKSLGTKNRFCGNKSAYVLI